MQTRPVHGKEESNERARAPCCARAFRSHVARAYRVLWAFWGVFCSSGQPESLRSDSLGLVVIEGGLHDRAVGTAKRVMLIGKGHFPQFGITIRRQAEESSPKSFDHGGHSRLARPEGQFQLLLSNRELAKNLVFPILISNPSASLSLQIALQDPEGMACLIDCSTWIKAESTLQSLKSSNHRSAPMTPSHRYEPAFFRVPYNAGPA